MAIIDRQVSELVYAHDVSIVDETAMAIDVSSANAKFSCAFPCAHTIRADRTIDLWTIHCHWQWI